MKCPIETQEIAEWLVAYCAGRLDPERTRLLERHLEECPACGGAVRDQRALWQALDAWENSPIPEDFDRRLYRRIDSETRSSWRPVLLGRWLPLAAAAGLLIVAGALLDQRRELPAFTPGDQVRVESVQAEQVERTLDDMELIVQFNRELRAEAQTSDRM